MSIKPLCIDESIDNIVNTYSNMVYRLAFSQTRNKSDADDIFQEVFLRYIKNKPNFETEEHRKAWLIRVTINCAKKLWASSWAKKTQPLDDEIAFETEEDNNLHYELKKLPIKYRTVIHLFYYEDLSIEEISHILKQKPSTVRTQLTRGRRKLKEILKEDYDV
ncbi:sigma-70 family RNA polymerase sigma factor [uncultured Tissierella sp.]|uniref:RNA polymerase sigma factor n=1 Tax=uncultured Tissierella sp. TaxID=448160 RepID=UPI002803ADA2|nr:sigma-70 family RNA polymerase sigma factor [uncultured Tissierella sp.]MDU5080493.1 sigma-70 family RNA polymerase sigma factor [Bacillota bacterium]